MTDTAFRVEEFLEAITTQLDRTQDALRLKAVNRPLTYAIRDFSLDLKVFVEMDSDQQVRFLPSGPNDTGASTVSIGFTTITRPMIEENTIALEEVQSPSLDELGLEPEDQRSLERLGVRNAAQLRKLNSSSGEGAVSKFANVPVNRLRAALQASRPQVEEVTSDSRRLDAPGGRRAEPVDVAPDARRLQLRGRNLRSLRDTAVASLNGEPVAIVSSEDELVTIDLGDLQPHGRLDVATGNNETLSFELRSSSEPPPASDEDPDVWTPS